jgi:starch-binding outer membrane protein, SusD/RagB family
MTTKRNLSRVMAVAAVTVTLGACDFISPVESNPNAVPEATVDQLFTGVQVNTFFIGVGGLSRLSSIWTQQMAGTDRQFVSFDNYQITEQDFDDEMDALYTGGGLIDVRQAIALAEAAGRTPYAGILKVHEAFMVGTIASYYGAIPYSEAVNPDIEVPAVDDQAAVYAALQALLDEAIADLGGAGAGPGAADLGFAGNTARWIAVANTLKARYHMHWAEVDPTRYASARTAAQAGIAEAAGNWRAQFSTAATENNLWHQFERDRSGYVSAGEHLVPLMIANTDPRIGIYFDDAPTPTPRVSTLSPTGYGAPDFDFPMVTCSENYFIIAEAEMMDGTADEAAARTAARAAAACQEAQHGLAADALGSATGFAGAGAALLTEILEQKYVAQFLNPEALNDYKRTCQPALAGAAGMPGRPYYSINERQSNPNIPAPGQGTNGTRNANDPNACP